MIFWRLYIFLFLSLFLYTHKSYSEEAPPRVGNFLLPSSQQPGPLIGFGENILGESVTQAGVTFDNFRGHKTRTTDIITTILYGITDNFSAGLNVPIAARFKEYEDHSSGLEDTSLQLEYAPYTRTNSTFEEQATIVGSIYFPTGSSKKNPPTGCGAVSYFLGGTFNRTYVNWFIFSSHGVVLTTSCEKTRFGNQLLYQFGFGRNIFNIGTEWTFAWMLEADGQYTKKNIVRGVIDPDSGGNIVNTTPSLWLSSRRFIFQLGVGVPLIQHLFGQQPKNNYFFITNLAWTF